MSNAGWPVQQAVFALLRPALLPIKVYDHVPKSAQLPYVVIGDSTDIPAGDKVADGADIRLTLHSWSQGRGKKEIKLLQGRIFDVLDDADLTIPGFSLRDISQVFSSVGRDADGVTYHGVQDFRIIVDAV